MNMEGLPGVWGNKGTREQGSMSLFLGNGGTKLYKLEDENILIWEIRSVISEILFICSFMHHCHQFCLLYTRETKSRLSAGSLGVWESDFSHWWNGQKPKHATERTQTSDEKWWRQQSHCWAPFKDETSNWLGLCDMYNVFYRLVSTSYFRKLDY